MSKMTDAALVRQVVARAEWWRDNNPLGVIRTEDNWDRRELLVSDSTNFVRLDWYNAYGDPTQRTLAVMLGYNMDAPAYHAEIDSEERVMNSPPDGFFQKVRAQLETGFVCGKYGVPYGIIRNDEVVALRWTQFGVTRRGDDRYAHHGDCQYVLEGYRLPSEFSFAEGESIAHMQRFWELVAAGLVVDLTDLLNSHPGEIWSVIGTGEELPQLEVEQPGGNPRLGPKYIFWHGMDDRPDGPMLRLFLDRAVQYGPQRTQLRGCFGEGNDTV
jgi:hypothetical protein